MSDNVSVKVRPAAKAGSCVLCGRDDVDVAEIQSTSENRSLVVTACEGCLEEIRAKARDAFHPEPDGSVRLSPRVATRRDTSGVCISGLG